MQDLFFTQKQDNPHKQLCCCDTKLRVTGTSYTTLVSHLCKKHSNEYSAALGGAAFQSSSRDWDAYHEGNSEAFLWKPWMVKVHGWLQLIIHNLFPFSALQNQDVQCHVKYEALSLNSGMKYVGLLTMSVEKKDASALPDRFALVIDDWTEAGSYYPCEYATFSADKKIEFESFPLGITLLSEKKNCTQQRSTKRSFSLYKMHLRSARKTSSHWSTITAQRIDFLLTSCLATLLVVQVTDTT